MNINELLEKKKALVQEAEGIRDRVYKDQDGEWRGDDEKKFDELMAQAETISHQVDRLAKLDAAQKSLLDADTSQGRRSSPTQPGSTALRRKASTEDRALALAGWVMGCNPESVDLVTDRHRDAAQRCGISLDQRNLRIRLAPTALTSLRADQIAEWEKRITQVDVVSPDLGGHYTVPDEMMRPLELALLQFGAMRQVAEVIRTNTGADLPMPTLDDSSNKGALLGETLEHTELDLTFGQLVLQAFKYTSRRVGMSVEYLQDNAVNAAGRIGAILGERIARITNEHFTTADGSAKPKGIVTAATTSAVTTAGAAVISYDNLIDLKHSVDPAYRALGARFMFNDTTLKILKKIKIPQYSGDTTGMPLWRAGLATGEPDTIDGDPYTINQDVASGTGTKAVIYGYLRKYVIREVRDVTLVRLDERYAELGIVAFLAFSRADGDLLDAGTHPVKYLTMG
jgi:HK97 family phage major capsid protein